MITTLTPDQEKLVPILVKKWIDNSSTGKRIKESDLTEGINWLYKASGFKNPNIIVTNSPLEAQELGLKGTLVGSIIDEKVVRPMTDRIWYALRDSVDYTLLNKLLKDISDNIFTTISNPVASEVNIWMKRSPNCHPIFSGLDYDSNWMSYYQLFSQIDMLKDEELDIYTELFGKGIWNCIMLEDTCVVSMTPKAIRKDERNRLHSTSKPSVEFNNGDGPRHIHGVAFETPLWKTVVERTIEPMDLMKIKNTDQRFVAMNHYGFEKVLKALNPTKIHASKRGNQLFQVKFDNVNLEYLLYKDTVNGENRISFVKPGLMNADKAMSWKHHMTVEEYNKLKLEA